MRHYNSWVAFAKSYGHVEPVLVSGFDMTKDFAMTAYSNDDASFESDLSISVPTRASASAFFEVESSGSTHTKRGPQKRTPPDVSPEPTGAGCQNHSADDAVRARAKGPCLRGRTETAFTP